MVVFYYIISFQFMRFSAIKMQKVRGVKKNKTKQKQKRKIVINPDEAVSYNMACYFTLYSRKPDAILLLQLVTPSC